MWSGGGRGGGRSGIDEDDKLNRTQTRVVLARSIRMAGEFRRHAAWALVLVTITVLCTLAGPVLVRHGIDAGIKAKDASALNITVVAYLVVVAIAYVIGRMQYVVLNKAGEGFLRLLRVKVFAQLQRQSMAFFDREKAGVLVARMTADIESMAELVQWGLMQFLSAFLLLFLAFFLLLSLSWQLTLITLIVFPFLIAASVKFQRDSNRAYLEVREKVGANLSALQEGITGVRVIQAYAREDEQIRRFEESNRALFRSHMYSVKVSTWYFGLIEFAGIASSALIVGVGGWLVHRGTVSLGTVVAFVLLLANLFDPVQQLSQLYNTLQSAAAALHKLFGILDAVPDVNESDSPVSLPATGDVEVRDISFTYASGSQPALSNVSVTLTAGTRLALVGPTGAGKSTLAKLMARLYDPQTGQVLFGGVDLRDSSLEDLRKRIVVIPQEGFLFDGSVRDNLLIARPDATEDMLLGALNNLGLRERFESLPEGLDTQVRERGSRLSAGERQLVALSRAALVDPAVLVLDEATSNLDPGTEMLIEAALEKLMAGRSVIVVAHRLSTVQRADKIAVVSDARITEIGSHDELIAMGGHYAALVNNWNKSQPQ
ncbi:MAG: ABC transporter ATP-binding protein/permease [Ilumatobacteraceae bacterium]|jgi:ATP-binding cassette subfamily B protein|nr:ABC transporter ATP-binding protein/permease [Ilumatobacteraceae bacterium]